MSAVRPGSKVRTQQQVGCTEVISCSRHWPCLFPQHGPGRKHMRKIELQSWQHAIVTENAGHFARGLFHSDGYRGINRVRARLADGDHWYEYPRYLFTNESADILRLCGETLDRLGVAWRFSRRNSISVARGVPVTYVAPVFRARRQSVQPAGRGGAGQGVSGPR